MTLETWLPYALASSILLAIPGPTILLVISYALTRGRAATLPLVIGVALGDLTAMTLSFLGLGLLLQEAATWFVVLKWIGSAYLIWLGWQLWRSPVLVSTEADQDQPVVPWQELVWRTWLTTALNPKGIVFFLAFVPQFLEPKQPYLPQILLLGGTFLVLAVLNALGYALLASRLGEWIRQPLARRWLNRTGGGLLLGAGAVTAAS